MDEIEKQRIRALCERVAAFIEANDTVERGQLTAEHCRESFLGGMRSAWVTDAQGRRWMIGLTKRLTGDVPTISEISIGNVMTFDSLDGDRKDLFPYIKLRLDEYPECRGYQKQVRDQLVHAALPMRSKRWLQRGGAGLRDSWTDLASDAWAPDDLTTIAVEFELGAIEALLEEILRGTVTKDERGLERRRERAQHEADVRRAYAHIIVLSVDDRDALNGHLIALLTPLHVEREYMAIDMGDMQDWLESTRREMRDTLVLDAFYAGAELVVIHSLHEDGGLVTAQLSQIGEMLTWADRVRGIEALDALHPGAVRRHREAYASLERDVAVLTREELGRAGANQLELVATLDASAWPRAHRESEPDDEQSRATYARHIVPFLRRKAAAAGGTVVVYERDAVTEEVRGAKVYRPRPAAPS